MNEIVNKFYMNYSKLGKAFSRRGDETLKQCLCLCFYTNNSILTLIVAKSASDGQKLLLLLIVVLFISSPISGDTLSRYCELKDTGDVADSDEPIIELLHAALASLLVLFNSSGRTTKTIDAKQ